MSYTQKYNSKVYSWHESMVLSNCGINLICTETSFHLLVRVNRLCSFEENITSLQSILTDFYHIPDAPRPKSDLPMHDLIWKVGATRNDQDPIATKQLFIEYIATSF